MLDEPAFREPGLAPMLVLLHGCHQDARDFAFGTRMNDPNKEPTMNMTLSLAPLVSLIAGILILLVPRLLNYIVAVYLIVIGLLGLFGGGSLHLR